MIAPVARSCGMGYQPMIYQFRKTWAGSPCYSNSFSRSMLQPIQRMCEDDDRAGDDLLFGIGAAEFGAAVGDDGHEQRPDERAEDRSFAAREACAADDD